jgi:hypothetical protein
MLIHLKTSKTVINFGGGVTMGWVSEEMGPLSMSQMIHE